MNFKEMLLQAKAGRELAVMALLEMYKPLLVKYAIINGRFDEDLYQELCIIWLKCIWLFRCKEQTAGEGRPFQILCKLKKLT